jgi:hypothetical protein
MEQPALINKKALWGILIPRWIVGMIPIVFIYVLAFLLFGNLRILGISLAIFALPIVVGTFLFAGLPIIAYEEKDERKEILERVCKVADFSAVLLNVLLLAALIVVVMSPIVTGISGREIGDRLRNTLVYVDPENCSAMVEGRKYYLTQEVNALIPLYNNDLVHEFMMIADFPVVFLHATRIEDTVWFYISPFPHTNFWVKQADTQCSPEIIH